MGKKAKAHRAKVKKRNEIVKINNNKREKEFKLLFDERMEKMKEMMESMSGDTMLLDGIDTDNEINDEKLRDTYPHNIEPNFNFSELSIEDMSIDVETTE
jgi:hypothetical protein